VEEGRETKERRRRESEESTRERERVVSDLTRGDRRCKRATHGPTRPVRVMGCMTGSVDEVGEWMGG
jgi:hypothetical protein